MSTERFGQWVEHFFILPTRWFKLHNKARRNMQQRCKVCGCRDKFDFHIPNRIWKKVIPKSYQNHVVCLACFDDFAEKKGVNYSNSLKILYFTGSKAIFQFQCIHALNKNN